MAVDSIGANSSMYTLSKNDNGVIKINYDDPNIRDEECTYTFNPDGSASCVSNAWGTKTEFPKGTFVNDGKPVSPEEMVNLYKSYQNSKKLDVNA